MRSTSIPRVTSLRGPGGGAIAALLSLMLCACAAAPPAVEYASAPDGPYGHPVYIVSHGWHTGIAVPAGPIQKRLPTLRRRFGEASYLDFGWGDSAYFRAQEPGLILALRAALWPTDTTMRVMARSRRPRGWIATGVVGLCVGGRAFDSLLRFIVNSFATTDAGGIRPLPAESGSRNSQFYAGTGQYHLLNTSNAWAAKALKSAGVDISPGLKLTAGSVMDYLHEYPQAAVLVRQRTATGEEFTCGDRQATSVGAAR